MTNRLFLRFTLVLLTVSTAIFQGFSQDSVKKTAPRPIIRKAVIPPPYRTYPPKTTGTPMAGQPGTQVNKPLVPVAAKPIYAPFDTTALKNKSLNEQYQYVLSKFYRYQQPIITALWKSYADTLHASHLALKDVNTKLTAQLKTIDSLKTDTAAKSKPVTEKSSNPSDTIDVLGVEIAKSTYNIVMGGLVIGLALALLIVIITTAKHRHEARYRSTLYDELEEEYKTYKAKANEKEKKLARELQTERNKLDELLGR